MTKETIELAVFDEVAVIIADYKEKNEELVFDYATPVGEKDARSHIAKLRKVKTKVGEIHKGAKAEALAFGRKLDAKKNEYNGEVDKMIARHKDPLDAIEAEKQAVIDAEKKWLEAKAEAEAKELAAIRAKEAEEAKEKRRIENKKHRAYIESQILESLARLGCDDKTAESILEALMENRIPCVSINY